MEKSVKSFNYVMDAWKETGTKKRMRYLIKEQTGLLGQGIAEEISFPLNKVENLVSRYDSTPAGFINLLVCIAMERYNGKPSYAENVMDNRSPNENHAGMRLSIGAVGLTSRSRFLSDLFNDIDEQLYQTLRQAYYNYDIYVEREDDYASMTVSYIADWFSSDYMIKSFGKPLPLENQHIETEGRPALNTQVRHEDGKMVFQFQYDRRYLSEEHAKDFVALLKDTGDELLKGKVPEYALDQ